MDENAKGSVNFRKFQEAQANMLTAGFHVEIAKWHKALFEAYQSVGFSPDESLELVKAHIK